MHRLLLAAVVIAPLIAQPPSAPPNAILAGTVRDAISGQPLAHAQARLLPMGDGKQYQTITDAAGAFRFNAVAPGAYRFETARPTYEDSHMAVLKDGASPTSIIQLAAGDSLSDVRIALRPYGAISGRVRDPNGDPMDGAVVVVIAERWRRGHRQFQDVVNALADDTGQYRILLPAGRYYVMTTGSRRDSRIPDVFAADPGGQEMRLGPVVYPWAGEIEGGTPLEIDAGRQVTGIDFKLSVVPCYHVRGAVKAIGTTGPLLLVSPDEGWWSGSYVAALRSDGSFDISGVLPGQYVLKLYPAGYMIGSRVEVKDRDVNGIEAAPLKPVPISGRIRMADPAREISGRIAFLSIDPRLYSADAMSSKPDGTFTVGNLMPGRYAVIATPDSGPYVSSVLLDGRELPGGVLDLSHGLAGPIEIFLDTARGQITGKLRFDGESVPEAVAVLVSADGQTGNTRARQTPLDHDGRFQFAAVPAGRWYVFAVQRFNEDLWQNMDLVLALASGAATAEVSRNGNAQVEVTLISADDLGRAIAGVPR